MQARPDAMGMRHAASQLRARADRVSAVHNRLNGQVAAMTFTGPAAQRFRNVMTAELERMRETARVLADAATTLNQAAINVENDPLGFYQNGPT